jgi:hypothetical protein
MLVLPVPGACQEHAPGWLDSQLLDQVRFDQQRLQLAQLGQRVGGQHQVVPRPVLHRGPVGAAAFAQRCLDVVVADEDLLARTRRVAEGPHRGILDQVGQRGGRPPVGARRQGVQVDRVGTAGPPPEVHLQDGAASGPIRQVHPHVPVEPPGPDHGRVEVVDVVGRGHHQDVGLIGDLLDADQQLVDRPALLRVPCGLPALGDGVELVEEQQGRARRARRRERPVNVGRAGTDDALHQVTGGQVQQGQAELPRDGAGQVGLAGARRAVQQQAVEGHLVVAGGVPMVQHHPDAVAQRGLQLLHAAKVGKRGQLIRGHHLELLVGRTSHLHVVHAERLQAFREHLPDAGRLDLRDEALELFPLLPLALFVAALGDQHGDDNRHRQQGQGQPDHGVRPGPVTVCPLCPPRPCVVLSRPAASR